MELLQDYVAQFMLYYGTDVPKMVLWEKEKSRMEENRDGERGEDEPPPLKQASRKDAYCICLSAGLGEFHASSVCVLHRNL